MTRDEMIEQLQQALEAGKQGYGPGFRQPIKRVLAALHASPVGAEPPQAPVVSVQAVLAAFHRWRKTFSSDRGFTHSEGIALVQAIERAAWTPAQAEPAAPLDVLSASEALYAFAGWLTSRSERTVMSATDLATPAADRVAEFCKRHALAEPREGWWKLIVREPAPSARPTPAAVPERIETCERCQMKLPEHLGTHTPGIRGSMAWRCAACLPIEGPSGRLLREKVIEIRKRPRPAAVPTEEQQL